MDRAWPDQAIRRIASTTTLPQNEAAKLNQVRVVLCGMRDHMQAAAFLSRGACGADPHPYLTEAIAVQAVIDHVVVRKSRVRQIKKRGSKCDQLQCHARPIRDHRRISAKPYLTPYSGVLRANKIGSFASR
jgi:hypothetical protein